MSDELNLCNCGGRAEYGQVPFDPRIPPEYQRDYGGQYIACAECGMSTNLVFNTMGDDVRAILREKWNRRAPSPAVKALVEACRAIKEYEISGAPDFRDWDSRYSAMHAALAAVEKEIGSA